MIALFHVDGSDRGRSLRRADIDVVAGLDFSRSRDDGREIGGLHFAGLNGDDAALANLNAGQHSAGDQYK